MSIQEQILYEDKHIIVLTKHVGQLSQPDKNNNPNLKNMIEDYLMSSGQRSKSPFVGVIHRLDRPVGGVMVFGKTKEGTAQLNKQLQEKGFKKEYLAIVKGKLQNPCGTLKHTLLKNQRLNLSKVVSEGTPKGKLAHLDYEVLSTQEHSTLGTISLVKIILHTGRHHQIRVQFSQIGHPLVGDNKYGPKDRYPIGLWAYGLHLTIPFIKEERPFYQLPDETPFDWFDLNVL